MKTSGTSFIGNKFLYSILKDSYLNSTLSHSIIISGDKGIGKSSFIKDFVQQIFINFDHVNNNINSKHIPLLLNNSHPNFKLINRQIDDKTKKLRNSIVIEQIRNLRLFVYQSRVFDLPKIVLIDSADDLNISSSNALLKTLEEPKQNTYFFLISHQPSKVISTIRSRCIKYLFKKPNFEDFRKIIISNINNSIHDDEIHYLYDLSNGSPGMALNLYNENIIDIFEQITDVLKEKKLLSKRILNLSSNVEKSNNDEFLNFLTIIKFILNNLLKIHMGVNIDNKFSKKITKRLYEISRYLLSSSCIQGLDYVKEHENDLITFNLDKRLFTINLFSELAN